MPASWQTTIVHSCRLPIVVASALIGLGACDLFPEVSPDSMVGDASDVDTASGQDAPSADARQDVAVDTVPDVTTDGQQDVTADAEQDVTLEDRADGEPTCGFAPTPPAGSCPSVCDDCEAGTCNIRCAGNQQCKQTDIICPSDMACHVFCSGSQSCAEAEIRCPDDYACTVACESEQSCKQSRLDCGSGPCTLACPGQPQSCQQMDMNCGSNTCVVDDCPSDGDPTVHCGQSCLCSDCS